MAVWRALLGPAIALVPGAVPLRVAVSVLGPIRGLLTGLGI